jgi:ribose-phosphate pyrophosphokinase
MLLDLNVYPDSKTGPDIYWNYENDEECMRLYYIVKHIKEHVPNANIVLTMPYLPNARMDRTKDKKEVFTLKYFCEFINSLDFAKVRILDPHSDVGVALLNHVEVMTDYLEMLINNAVNKAFEDVDDENALIFFPDAGAMKRYKDMKAFKHMDMVYGQKQREWKTGKILGVDIMDKNGERLVSKGSLPLEGKSILMVDDIISYGGTLYHCALRLKELGADKIYAYATHTENSVLDMENGTFRKCLDDGTVVKLYTSDSLYSGEHPSIKVLN